MRGLFRRTILLLLGSEPGRWVLSGLLLLMGAFFLLGGVVGGAKDALALLIGGVLFLGLGVASIIFIIVLRRTAKAATAHAKRLIAEGKLLPLPPLPAPPKSIAPDTLLRIEGYANQLNTIPWGDKPRVPAAQAPALFNQTVATTRRITGDWSRLSEPIQTFAAMPQPWCNVGAAEVMFRLSFVEGKRFAPVGLRQGLRFTTRAQLHTPLQPDALVIQIKLLAACTAPTWQKYATQAVELAQHEAPNHPRLPNSMLFYHDMRGEYEEALHWADRAITSGPTREDVYAARSRKANILDSLRRYDEALAVYHASLREDPRDPWTWHNAALALTKLGRYDEALACSDRALAIMDFTTARNLRDVILKKMAEGQTAD